MPRGHEIIFVSMIAIGIIVIAISVVIAAAVTGYEWYIWSIIVFGALFFIAGVVGIIISYYNNKNVKDDKDVKLVKNNDNNEDVEKSCFEKYIDSIDTSNLDVKCTTGQIQRSLDNNVVGCPNLGSYICADPDKTVKIKENILGDKNIKVVNANDVKSLTPV